LNRYKTNENIEIDIYIPSLKIGIEYDGHYYHSKDKNIKQDEKKNNILAQLGVRLIRVRENKCPNIETYGQYTMNCTPKRGYSYLDNVIIDIFEIIKKISTINNASHTISNFTPDVKRDLNEIYGMICFNYMENNICKTHPLIASEWNYEKNVDLLPENFTFGSRAEVWWKCKENHEWKAPISRRTNNVQCPFCTGRYADSINNLLALYPDISKEWHPLKNKIKPENVTAHSNLKVWWQCKEGHEWQATIDNRTKSNGTRCPICARKSIKKTRINNLLLAGHTLCNEFPNISAQWHPTMNFSLLPSDFVPGSNKKVWWKCPKCNISWQATINNRTNKKSGCPNCAKKYSRMSCSF